MTLAVADFCGVFEAVHGVPPFAWQSRLLNMVIENGWPEVVAAPTGAGKTAVLDVALFHLALGLQPRTAPRRVVLAVDRRIIVDQAFDRAKTLKCRLHGASRGPMAAMAAALRILGGDEQPLHVAQLRGGMPLEDDWARTPTQPTILCTTIDQLGSRLLFRGYGVSRSMAPVHAGLLGQDTLVLLDEAHLSEPFRQTLDAIRLWRKNSSQAIELPWHFCALTATPRETDRGIFALNIEERRDPAIRPRLIAAKSAQLVQTGAAPGSDEQADVIARAAVDLEARCLRNCPVVAVVVNRVRLARLVHQKLIALRGPEQTILLTGRVRPLERDALIKRYETRLLGAETPADEQEKTLFVVATQCVEVGADFSFDAMVTQIASLDALRQRFGRLNRRAMLSAAPCIVVATRKELGRDPDAVYGHTLAPTWEWLDRAAVGGEIDLSVESLEALVARYKDTAEACIPPAALAPVLRPADIGFFATTSPIPSPDPYLPLFLRGEVEVEADVSIVWRADCEVITTGNSGAARDIVACMPPRVGEALRVPLWAARALLDDRRDVAADISDTEASRPSALWPEGSQPRMALRWRGESDDATKLIQPNELRAGDVIVVPASYGGCDEFGWAPDSGRAEDIAAVAARPYWPRLFALRLHPSVWPREDGCALWEDIHERLAEAAEDGARAVRDLLDSMPNLPAVIAEDLASLPRNIRVELETPYADEGWVLVAPHGIVVASTDGAEPATESDDIGSASGIAVPLRRHAADVENQVRRFAELLRLDDSLSATLAFAAGHHDDGKADPRFQLWLAGAAGQDGEPLAKSGRWLGRSAETALRRAAGVPKSWRHEVLSVRAAIPLLSAGTEVAGIDPDLALYLIGSHHGQGRPFFEHDDPWDEHERTLLGRRLPPGPGAQRLDFEWNRQGWVELFTGLQADYGTWGLAFLEAVLRLADHRASEAPS